MAEKYRQIERGQGALADDHGMNKFHRDVLRVGGIGSAAEGQQAPSAQKPLGHFTAGSGQPRRLAVKKLSNS